MIKLNFIDRITEELSNRHDDEIVNSRVYESLGNILRDECKSLLREFWQSRSDACPMDCTDAAKQEAEFELWIKTTGVCLPDEVRTKEDCDDFLKVINQNCDNCAEVECRESPEYKKCSEALENWKLKL